MKFTWEAKMFGANKGKIGVTVKVKRKNTCFEYTLSDTNACPDDFDEKFAEELEKTFGKKKGKKIFDQILTQFEKL